MSATKGKQGFASMHRDDVKRIARMGGIMAHLKGVAHTWTKDEARAAGKKGGEANKGKRKPLEVA